MHKSHNYFLDSPQSSVVGVCMQNDVGEAICKTKRGELEG